MRAFVIAMECEAECVRPHLKSDDRLYVAGIGKVNAAAATQRAICEGADEIWNAGLCGGFGDDIEVGDVFTVESAVEYDFDLAKLNAIRRICRSPRLNPAVRRLFLRESWRRATTSTTARRTMR